MWLRCFVLIVALWRADASHFRGSFITWVVNSTDYNYYPANSYAPLAKVHVKYGASWRRSDGNSYCHNSSITNCQFFNHGSWSLYYTSGSGTPQTYHSSFTAGFFCEKYSVDSDFTIGSNRATLYLPKDYTYRAVTSSCCWVYGLYSYSSSYWNVEATISLRKTNNGYSNLKVNTPPQISHIPVIQHNHYWSTSYKLPVHDPDGDKIECRWAANYSEGGGVWNSRIPSATLSPNCVLSLPTYHSGYIGWYALAVMVEDFEYNYVWYRYEKRNSVPLQFTVQIYAGNGSTIYGQNVTNCTSPWYHHASIASVTPSLSQSSSMPMMSSSAVPSTPPMKALDGCKYYQVLDEADRASTYSDWSHYRCDQELFGWYRFMGKAGNRLSTTCPSSSGYSYWCGTYYQGWIQYGGMPAQYEGAVSRSVCFSRYGYCYCSYTKSILVKNCGNFYVYWIDGVPSCNSRYCGVKDKTATMSCSNNYMRVEFDRQYYNTSLYSSITLRDPSCRASIYYSTIVLGSVPGACGSVRIDTYSHIIYENEVIFTGKSENGLITRNLDQRVKVSCYYDRTAHVQTVSYTPTSNVTGEETGYGNFTFFFVMYTDHRYVRMHSYYPVAVKVRDWIYLEIYANNIDSNIVVLIDQCYSTPTMDRNHPMKYTFISNRCPTDNTVQFHSTSSSRQRFSMQAFRYVQNSTAVFLHCLVFLCHSTSTDYRCRYGCAGNNIYRGKRSIDEESAQAPSSVYLVDMQVTLDMKQGTESDASKENLSIGGKIGYSVGITVAVAIIAGLVITVMKLKKKVKVLPREGKYADEAETDIQISERQIESEVNLAYLGVLSSDKQADMFKDKAMCS